jgi:hypothetical protein
MLTIGSLNSTFHLKTPLFEKSRSAAQETTVGAVRSIVVVAEVKGVVGPVFDAESLTEFESKLKTWLPADILFTVTV